MYKSELQELKLTWFIYNKKINSLLLILPQENLQRYDSVSKTLQMPVFDLNKNKENKTFIEQFNEIVYKMASYYFSVFQTIFSKDNDSIRPEIQEYIEIQDPLRRSRKVISLYKELHEIIDKKLYYVQQMGDEFRERSKTALLEQAY